MTTPVPTLNDLTGQWVSAADTAQPPSVRNFRGQALCNRDLVSLSWLAAPPYAFGYHTGVLRVNGEVPLADAFRWSAYATQRKARVGDLSLHSEVRMVPESYGLLWRVDLKNEGAAPVPADLQLDLNALVRHIPAHWGWLYGQPWKNGVHHMYFAMERLRASIAHPDDQRFLLSPIEQVLYVGAEPAAVAAGQEAEVMACETSLPQHISAEAPRPDRRAPDARITLAAAYDRALSPAELGRVAAAGAAPGEGRVAELAEAADLTGERAGIPLGRTTFTRGQATFVVHTVIRAHRPGARHLLSQGNNPDSMYLLVQDGCLRFELGGDVIATKEQLPTGRPLSIAAVFDGRQARLYLDGKEVGQTTPWWDAPEWTSRVEDSRVLVQDTTSRAAAAFVVGGRPDRLTTRGSGARAGWTRTLAPGETLRLEWSLAWGDDLAACADQAAKWAVSTDTHFDGVPARWQEVWSAVFQPGNAIFGGHLPVLETGDDALRRAYYMSALSLIYLMQTHLRTVPRAYLSGGPRFGPTVEFFWDTHETCLLLALLDPEGVKIRVRHWLSLDLTRCFAVDNWNGGPVGNGYVANHTSIFRLIETYLRIHGDWAWLDEVIQAPGSAGVPPAPIGVPPMGRSGEHIPSPSAPGGTPAVTGGTPALPGKTLLDHLRDLALRYERLGRPETGGVLADYGPNHNDLLECVPHYKHVVASFNASHLLCVEALASICTQTGRAEEAEELKAKAEVLAKGVMGLYAGKGRWYTLHPGGRRQPVHHIMDFQFTCPALANRMDAGMKQELADFFERELMTDHWMRAQSLDDPDAAVSDRPDHGPMGAFGAWPGKAVLALGAVGAYELAARFVRSLEGTYREGCWAQALELYGPRRRAKDAPVRVSDAGANCRDLTSAAVMVSAIIEGLFGCTFGMDGRLTVRHPDAPRPISARLHNLRYRGKLFDVSMDQGAPRLSPHGDDRGSISP